MQIQRKSCLIAIFSLTFGAIILLALMRNTIAPDASRLLRFWRTQRMLATITETLAGRVDLAPAPTGQAAPSRWLETVNELRAQSGLPMVSENASWSAACQLHSRYMVKNDALTHTEERSNTWYTAVGAAAAKNSNVMASSDIRTPDEAAIALWLSEPFHGIGILDPRLKTVGFGSYREATGTWKMAAALDVARGHIAAEPAPGTYPMLWPPDGKTTPIRAYDGTEWPDPLTSCPNYKAPSGPPIYLQIGSGGATPNVTASAFRTGDKNLEHCVFDETNYVNPGTNNEQEVGRGSLASRDAIILMPQQPLLPGTPYTVSITVNGQTYTWSFTAER